MPMVETSSCVLYIISLRKHSGAYCSICDFWFISYVMFIYSYNFGEICAATAFRIIPGPLKKNMLRRLLYKTASNLRVGWQKTLPQGFKFLETEENTARLRASRYWSRGKIITVSGRPDTGVGRK